MLSRSKITVFLKKWKVVIIAIGVFIVSYLLGKRFLPDIKKAVNGLVKNSQKFHVVPGDKRNVYVETDEGIKKVQLPENVRSDQVKAVEVVLGGETKVEIVHETVDRKNFSSSIADSAASRLGR